jgi:hypothetical protein
MTKYPFKRTNATYHEDGSVTLLESNVIEDIEIGADYMDGEAMLDMKKPIADYKHTAFIGRGYTKRGIYVCLIDLELDIADLWCSYSQARVLDKEFVLTQVRDKNEREGNVKITHVAEYKILTQAAAFKKAFDAHAATCNVNIPSTSSTPL